MLRAIRLAARLDFQIDPATLAAIYEHRSEIWKGATPRILEELHRMLREGASRRSFSLLMETGLLDMLLPELAGQLVDHRRAADFWSHLDALDRLRAGGHDFTMPVLLSVVAYQNFQSGLADVESERVDLHALAEESLGPMGKRLEIPKRHVDRAHAILLSQRRFVAPKRKGFQPGAFAGRPHFPEALDLLHIHAAANPDQMPVFDRWRQYRRPEAATEPASDLTGGPEQGVEVPRRRPRRRRRGGRKDEPTG
jgi:poly(A) polymerase